MFNRTLAKLVIKMTADSADVRKEMARAERSGAQFAKQMSGHLQTVAKAAPAMATAVAAATGKMVNDYAEVADASVKMADKLGLGVEQLSQLRHAAEITGVENSKLDMSLQRMTRRLSEAANGGGEAVKAIQELGLDAQELASKSPDQAFMDIAEAMTGVESQSDKVRLAFKFFDSEGVSLVNTMALGRDGLEAMAAESDRLGKTILEGPARAAELYNDNQTRVNGVLQGFKQNVAAQVLPTLINMGNSLVDTATNTNQLQKAAKFLADTLKAVVGAGSFVKNVFQTVGETLGAVAAAVVTAARGQFSEAWGILQDVPAIASRNYQEASQEIMATWDATLASTAKAAEDNAARVRAAMSQPVALGAVDGPDDKAAQREAEQAERQRQAMQAQLDREREAYASQEQLLQSTLDKRAALYQQFYDNGLIAEGEFNNLNTLAREEYWTNLAAMEAEREAQRIEREAERRQLANESLLNHLTNNLGLEYGFAEAIVNFKTAFAEQEAATLKQKFEATAGLIKSFAGQAAATSKTAFKVQQQASIAQAAVSTFEGAQKAFTSLAGIPIIGPVLGAAAAAAAIIAGQARIRSIKSQRFGGGGSVGGGAGSAPAVSAPLGSGAQPSTAVPRQDDDKPEREANITVVGSDSGLYDRNTVERIFDTAQELIRDGYTKVQVVGA